MKNPFFMGHPFQFVVIGIGLSVMVTASLIAKFNQTLSVIFGITGFAIAILSFILKGILGERAQRIKNRVQQERHHLEKSKAPGKILDADLMIEARKKEPIFKGGKIRAFFRNWTWIKTASAAAIGGIIFMALQFEYPRVMAVIVGVGGVIFSMIFSWIMTRKEKNKTGVQKLSNINSSQR